MRDSEDYLVELRNKGTNERIAYVSITDVRDPTSANTAILFRKAGEILLEQLKERCDANN